LSLQTELWCVLPLIILRAAKFALLSASFALKTRAADIYNTLRTHGVQLKSNECSNRMTRVQNVPRRAGRSGRPLSVRDGASELLRDFLHILLNVLYEIITFRQVRARCVPKLLSGEHNPQRMASTRALLQRYYKDWEEFLNHIERVTGTNTWASYCWYEQYCLPRYNAV
jgi:hypothetical protein